MALISDNKENNGNSHLELSTDYSFQVPDFVVDNSADGAAYKKTMEGITTLLKSHVDKSAEILKSEELLPSDVSEAMRVAVGRTELLIKKRMSQFNKQLDSHLNPNANDKVTTINDLHGLWSLVDMQLDDIRNCFKEVEKYRLTGWQSAKEQIA
ncbi:guanylate-kinase-associated protein (GKAP) protein [Ditylenchus destructor]|nr:guanylate-kinase-associated protein (GKAP) protein [Ditylenchus destructor]